MGEWACHLSVPGGRWEFGHRYALGALIGTDEGWLWVRMGISQGVQVASFNRNPTLRSG